MTLQQDSLESDVKKEFRKRIVAYGAMVKGTWIESRTSRSAGDWIGCVCGVYFSIEFKRPDGTGRLKGLQAFDAMSVVAAGGQCFVVDDIQTLDVAMEAIDRVTQYHRTRAM